MVNAEAGKIPVLECVRTSWMFLAEHWRRFAPAAAIVAVVAQAGLAFVYLSGAPAGTRSLLDATIATFIVDLPGLLAGIAFTAAILRKAVRDEFIGPTGLAAGADEARLLGVLASLMLMFLPVVFLAGFVLSFTVLGNLTQEQMDAIMAGGESGSEALVQALGDGGATAFALFLIVLTIVCLVILVRLFMVNAATIGERRIVLLQVWSWSNGNVLRMIGAFLLTWLPTFLIANLVYGILAAVTVEGLSFFVLLALNAVVTFVATMVSIPVVVLGAVLYKGLRPAGFTPK